MPGEVDKIQVQIEEPVQAAKSPVQEKEDAKESEPLNLDADDGWAADDLLIDDTDFANIKKIEPKEELPDQHTQPEFTSKDEETKKATVLPIEINDNWLDQNLNLGWDDVADLVIDSLKKP